MNEKTNIQQKKSNHQPKRLMKNILIPFSATAIAFMANSVMAETDVKISGWIFQTIVDRESEENIEFQPLGHSLNAIAFDATHDIGNGLTAGINLRISSYNSDLNNSFNSNVDQQSVSLSGKFGTFDLGLNHSATFTAEAYDGTSSYWVDPMGYFNRFGATSFSSTAGLASNIFTGGTTRVERLRYVSPTFEGATIKAQVGDNDSNELALFYNNYGLIANIFAINGGDNVEDTTGFLLAYNAPFGLHAAYSSSSQDRSTSGTDKVDGWKLGYSHNNHSIYYSTHTYDDSATDDYERSSITYVFSPIASFQAYVQTTEEERGNLDDSAVAVGVGIFF